MKSDKKYWVNILSFFYSPRCRWARALAILICAICTTSGCATIGSEINSTQYRIENSPTNRDAARAIADLVAKQFEFKIRNNIGVRSTVVAAYQLRMPNQEAIDLIVREKMASWGFGPEEIIQLEPFVARLNIPSQSDAISQYVRSCLSPETQKLLSNSHDALEPHLREALAGDLNGIIWSGFGIGHTNSIYTPQRFVGVRLSGETSRLLAEPNSNDLRHLNRLLLQDAYAQELGKSTNSDYIAISLGQLGTADRQNKTYLDVKVALTRLVAEKFGSEVTVETGNFRKPLF
jgi:hypothetical protein